MPRFIATAFLLAITTATAYLFIMPQWRTVREMKAAIRVLESVNSELNELAVSRDQLVNEYNAILQSDLDKLEAMVPADRGTASALSDFESLASRHGLSLDQVDFFPAEPPATGGLALPAASGSGALPVALRLRGSYEGFREFLGDLERNLRLTDVDEAAIISSTAGRDSPMTVKAVMYYRP